jgi:hypothetical protein
MQVSHIPICRITLLTASRGRSSGDLHNAVCVKRFREGNLRTFAIYGNYLTTHQNPYRAHATAHAMDKPHPISGGAFFSFSNHRRPTYVGTCGVERA